ncbi:MAG TPA: Gfo/Idh/MocA family oxidoreductase [Verrucomicrobiae bacterium]
MTQSPDNSPLFSSRRKFLQTTGTVIGASALSGVTLPHVFAQGSDQVRIALVGCGGRGTGAAANALETSGPPKLVAMADVFESKLSNSYTQLQKKYKDQLEVPPERKYIGFDGYKQAMDQLKKGDVVILATPPAFRWVHFKYAIEKGLNVFMEKPICVDAPTGRRMIALAEEAKKKNLKVAVGLMVRHCKGRQALFDKINKENAIGDVIAMRAYRMHPPVGSAFTDPSMRKEGQSELMFQISRFHSFLWASGGLFSDFYIHQIDECCWMKNSWPVKCHAIGGRHYRGDNIDQNFDSYQVEYTFNDGTKFFFYGRTMMGVKDEFSSIVHGAKGMATVSLGGHSLGRAGRIFKNHIMSSESQVWSYGEAPNPYQQEWDDFMAAIRHDEPYNEVVRSAEASMITAMGRFAAHTGQEVTWEDFKENKHEFAPNVDKLTLDGPAPLLADANGKYPIPEPGIKRDREY